MDSAEAIKYQLITFRIFGSWQKPSKFSIFYTIWTLTLFIFVGILFPLSIMLSVVFSNSISEMVDRMAIASSVIVVIVKAINVYKEQKKLEEFFHVAERLDKEITENDHISMFNGMLRFSQQIYFTFFYSFLSAWSMLVFQAIYSRPSSRLWSSTYSYPYEWAHHPYVYVGGLFFQGISNACIVIFSISTDTYVAVLNNVLAGHISILNNRLKRLGHTEVKVDSEKYHYEELVRCCRIYQDILRCGDLLEHVLGAALFAQYGVSGVVLCTSAYQLTSFSSEDLSKYAFTILYFICMLTELFFPCFFGSILTEKSDSITRYAYESSWIDKSETYKRAYRIFVVRTFYPIKIHAGGYIVLGLETFLKVLRRAYSLFALIKNS